MTSIDNKTLSGLKAVVLSDNKEKGIYCGEHGLSLYIEFDNEKILLDAGKSELFYENAQKLGIDLSQVDIAVLSHAHYDHADGFEKFFEINKKAKLYARSEAGEKYFSMHEDGLAYIGPKKGMLEKYKDRIVYVNSAFTFDNKKMSLIPHSAVGLQKIGEKAKLFKSESGELLPDDFKHEQTLVFETAKGLVLFNSCSHGGPDNILEEVRSYYRDKKIYAYIGGFHLFKSTDEEVYNFAERIKVLDIEHIITGHCTGDRAYDILKEKLGEKVEQMHAGKVYLLDL